MQDPNSHSLIPLNHSEYFSETQDLGFPQALMKTQFAGWMKGVILHKEDALQAPVYASVVQRGGALAPSTTHPILLEQHTPHINLSPSSSYTWCSYWIVVLIPSQFPRTLTIIFSHRPCLTIDFSWLFAKAQIHMLLTDNKTSQPFLKPSAGNCSVAFGDQSKYFFLIWKCQGRQPSLLLFPKFIDWWGLAGSGAGRQSLKNHGKLLGFLIQETTHQLQYIDVSRPLPQIILFTSF